MSLIQLPSISRTEIENKCGLGTRTDFPEVLSVAVQMAADKAEMACEGLLPQVGDRLKHVLNRVVQISCDLVSQSGSAGALLLTSSTQAKA